jgi:hypothetical protein
MKSIQTEIIINASAARVWQVLIDFDKHSTWNPFIVNISGKPQVGETLRVELKNGKGTSVFTPKVMVAEPNKAFEWLGKLPLGMFSGQHFFSIEEISATQVKLIHGENFSGWLAGLLLSQIGEQTQQSFIAMNKALKQVAESN